MTFKAPLARTCATSLRCGLPTAAASSSATIAAVETSSPDFNSARTTVPMTPFAMSGFSLSARIELSVRSSNVQEATAAFVGFERPQGYSAANPMGAHNWNGRLGAAEAALEKFGASATSATANLGTLGTGMDAFGNALVSGVNGISSGGAQGGLMGFLGTLASGIASSLGVPGFATGGVHAGGLRIVGERGPELEYTGPSTILPADLTRSVLGMRPPPTGNGNAPSVVQMQPVFQFNTSQKPDIQQEEFTDARGQRQQRYIFSDLTAEGLSTPGGRGARTLEQGWGMRRSAVRRP